MGGATQLGEILREHMRRPETFASIGILSKRSGVPKATIANWLEGRVARPRHCLDLLKVAAALHLGADEACALLVAGGYPPLRELQQTCAGSDERAILARWAVAPPPVAATPRPAPLPGPGGEFPAPQGLVGRDDELAALGQLLRQPAVQLVSLTGPGGVGKTSLALAVAAELRAHFADGVYLVSLAPISAPGLVLPTLARTLGLARTVGAGPDDTELAVVAGALQGRRALLLLDNFEQVAAAGPLLGELLAACPQLKALVTSRAALRIRAEQEFPVMPLAFPPAPPTMLEGGHTAAAHPPQPAELGRWAAVDLFVRRARACQPAFALSEDNAAAVAAVCRRLDGLPLAIELAAARVRMLPPATLLERLGAGDGAASLQVLTEGWSDGPVRQRTMRDAIAWSYGLLTAAEQRLFRRLAVFVGGFTLEAAEVVAGHGDGSLDGLSSLVNKSLVRPPAPTDRQGRLALLETIRAFGLAQLAEQGELEAVRRLHAQYFLALVERGEPGLRSPQQDRWLDRLAPDLDNVRAALEWSVEAARAGGADAGEAAMLGVRLAGVVWRFGFSRGHISETRRWLERALVCLQRLIRAGQPGLERYPGLEQARRAWAKALIGIGMVARMQGDLERAAACLDESLALGQTLGDRTIIADTLLSLGNVAWLQGDLDRTEELFGQCLALYEGLGDDLGAIWSLIGLGNVSLRRSDYSEADRLHQQGLERARRLGFKRMIAWSLTNQGATAIELGQLRRAEALLGEALALLRDLHDPQGIAHALCRLAMVSARQGEPGRATAYFEESLALHRELGDQPGALACTQGLASLRAREPELVAGDGAWPVREQSAGPRQCAVGRLRPCRGRTFERRRPVSSR